MTLLLPLLPIFVIIQIYFVLQVKNFKATIPLFIVSLITLFIFYNFVYSSMDITDAMVISATQKQELLTNTYIIYTSFIIYIGIFTSYIYWWLKVLRTSQQNQ